MDNIQVGIRVRPLIDREQDIKWTVKGNTIFPKSSSSNSYSFDHVFSSSVETDQIYYSLAKPIILSVMEGFNGTIFAYGQTSSGKTHTMMGGPHHVGIIPLSIGGIFDYIENHPEREFIICISYLEIYNETLTDLLSPENGELRIREDTEHNVRVQGVTVQAVTEPMDIARLLSIGEKNRSVGETNMNDRSSRSHTIFTLTVESRLRDEEGGDGTVKVASLNLVDLAGSERVSATGAEGIRFKEGTFINRSLLVLGNVISKLSEGNNSHIPFRESKLTRILQPSLGGNAKTCIICTVTPADVGETHSTLKFASRAKTIKNKPVVNEVLVGEEALLKKLKTYERENEHLRKRLEDGLPEQERQQLTEQLAEKEREKADLEHQMKTLQDIIVKSSVTGNSSVPLGKIKASRRQTVCPSVLSRDVGTSSSPAFSRAVFGISKVQATPVASSDFTPGPPIKRVTFVGSPVIASPSPSPFQPRFDRNSFEKHLQDIQYNQTPLMNRTKSCRPSFIPHVSSSPACISEDSLNYTETSLQTSVDSDSTCTNQMIDAQVQTDELNVRPNTDVECQTVFEATSLPSPSPAHFLRRSCVERPGLNDSLCIHKQETNKANERIEMMAFEADEMFIKYQELQQQLSDSKLTAAAQFEEERCALSQEISELKAQLQALQKKLLQCTPATPPASVLVKVTGEADAGRDQLEQLKEAQWVERERAKENHALQEKLAEVTGEADALRDQLEQMKSQSAELQSKLCDQWEQSRDPQEQNNVLQEQKKELLEENKALRQQNKALQEQNEDLQEQSKALLEHKKDLEEQNKDLQDQKEDLQEQNKDSLEENRDLQGQNKYLEEQSKDLQEQSKALQQQNEDLEQQNKYLQEQSKDLQEHKKDLEEQNKDLQKQSKALLENKRELEEQRKELQQQNMDLQEQNKDLQEQSKALLEQKKDLLEQNKDLQDENKDLTELVDQSEKEMNEAQWMEREREKENQALQEKLAEVTDEAGALRDQLNQLKGQRSDVQSSVHKLQEVNKDLNEQNSDLQEQNKDLQEENRDLKELVDQTEKERNEAHWVEREREKENQALQDKLVEMTAEAGTLRDQLEQLKGQMSEYCELKTEFHDLQEENRELQELFDQIDKEKNEAEFSEAQLEKKCDSLEEHIQELQAELKRVTASEAELQRFVELHVQKEQGQKSDQLCELEEQNKELEEENKELKELVTLTEKEANEALWSEDQLHKKCVSLEDQVQELEAELKRVTASEAELQRIIESQKEQLAKMTRSKTEPSKDIEELEETLKAVRRDNARLMRQIQGMAAVPTGPAEPVVDGSGAITGLAFYRLQIDKRLVDKKCESLEYKLDRLKSEYTNEKERHNKEREESKRYRHERNIYRTKYQAVKDNCTCGIMEKFRNDPSLISSSSQHNPNSRCSPDLGPTKTSNPLSVPSPHPGHKSVLSIKVPPDSNIANQRRPITAEAKPVASAPVVKRKLGEESNSRDAPKGVASKDLWLDENYWKNSNDGNRSPYFWERTFMNEPEVDTKKEQDSNCKTQ